MKNQSIQNMVRNQKMNAERQKEMVSYYIKSYQFIIILIVGTLRKTASTA